VSDEGAWHMATISKPISSHAPEKGTSDVSVRKGIFQSRELGGSEFFATLRPGLLPRQQIGSVRTLTAGYLYDSIKSGSLVQTALLLVSGRCASSSECG
jgi:hypothetical protein